MAHHKGLCWNNMFKYLLQRVYSSLLVTPLGGGLNCQPSSIPATQSGSPSAQLWSLNQPPSPKRVPCSHGVMSVV